jgi:hypothetical protein
VSIGGLVDEVALAVTGGESLLIVLDEAPELSVEGMLSLGLVDAPALRLGDDVTLPLSGVLPRSVAASVENTSESASSSFRRFASTSAQGR